MCKICKVFSGRGKINTRTCKGLLSLMLITTAFASCTDETESFVPKGTPLQLSVKTASIETRGLIESATLPDGHSIGLTLTDAGGSTYDNITYSNIKATASTGATPQTWTIEKDMLLSSTSGTLYGYYPYDKDVTDMTQIPVTAGDTDYMYATPVEKLTDGKYTANVTMNHALAAIRLNVVRGTYTGTGAVTAVSVKGDNIATSGKLNAKTGALTAQAGTGTAITYSTAFTLSTTAKQIDQIIVPVTSSSAAPTFTATIDGKDYTATPAAVTFAQGTIYEYTLTVNAKEISLSDVKVGDWGYNSSGNPVINAGYNIILAGNIEGIAFENVSNDDNTLTIYAVPRNAYQMVNSITGSVSGVWSQSLNDEGTRIITVNTGNLTKDLTLTFNGHKLMGMIDLKTASNGVYAVASNDKGVPSEYADATCKDVALIVNDAPTPQRFIIEKTEGYAYKMFELYHENETIMEELTDGTIQCEETYYWSAVSGFSNMPCVDHVGGGQSGEEGYLPQTYNPGAYYGSPNLSSDYTTWTSGALGDFNGKSNFEFIKNISNGYKVNKTPTLALIYDIMLINDIYTDWYVPSCGQLGLIHLNLSQINEVLNKIGGTQFDYDKTVYWNSTQYKFPDYGNYFAGYINIYSGLIGYSSIGGNRARVRFIRDIQ